ncbi:MAG: F0F1 ATP synthase subunit A [Patescibacteria group bacterium]|nr:MAG: F0F1 ATP synthase subunit A [Patescibacteria group bacterium]
MTIPPIAAEPIFHLGSFPITNSLINAWIAVGLFVLFAAFVRAKLTSGTPNRFQSAVEGLLEFLLGYVDGVTGDRAKSKKFLPLVASLFLFILVSNWMGLIPGVGSVWRTIDLHGHIENAPIFRPANADLNLTLAMALLTVIVSHFVGMITVGFFAHWNKFIALGTIFKGFRKGGINILVAIVEAAVGAIELVSEVAKVVSLSLRLFGNIFAGEVLITVMYSLVSYVVPLPFMLLELIVGVVQASVFSMLTLVYLTILSEKPHGHEEEHHEDELGEAHGLKPQPASAS